MAQRSTNRLAGLTQDVQITDVSESGNEFTAVLPHIQASCPYCNGSSVTSKGKSRRQTIYGSPIYLGVSTVKRGVSPRFTVVLLISLVSFKISCSIWC